MKPKQTISKTRLIIYITLGYIAILWFCIQAGSYNATYRADGLGEVLNRMFSSNGMFMYPIRFIAVHPVGIGQLVLLATIAYGIGLMYAWAVHKRDAAANDMTEYGTAHWETDFDSYNKIYTAPAGSTEKNGKTNMIFTQKVWMNMDTRKTRRNNNVLVVGGSGSGKTRFFVKPNLCQMPLNVSFICTDPSGELMQDTGNMLEGAGYKIKSFNLEDMTKSCRYNPLNYLNTENDVILLTDCILENTSDPQHSGGDKFWEDAQKLMLQAFLFLLWLHGDELGLRKTMPTLMDLMRGCTIDENADSTELNQTDKYFAAVEFGWSINDNNEIVPGAATHPYTETNAKQHKGYGAEDISVRQYKNFKMGAGKTLKSILISAMARLSLFDVHQVQVLFSADDVELEKISEEKTVLFVVIPQANRSFNFMAAMLYTQLFQELYFRAENRCRGNYVVSDANGEIVKIFESSHKEKEIENDQNAKEVDFDPSKYEKNQETEDKKSKKSSAKHKSAKKKKEQDVPERSSKKKKLPNPNMDEQEAKIYQMDQQASDNEAQTRPDDDPGKVDQIAHDTAVKFVNRMKSSVHATQKGKYIYIKVPQEDPSLPEDIVGVYTNPQFAIDRLNAIKNADMTHEKCISRLGLRLPFHVRFMLDEFANIGKIPEFPEKLATMRKYEISATVILQSLAQLESMYDKQYETVIGNCDSFLFLGASEEKTKEYVSKKLGKTTIRIRDTSFSNGKSKSSSISMKKAGRELMTQEELGSLSNDECILMIRGVYPFRDQKFKYEQHKNFVLTADGKAAPYRYVPPVQTAAPVPTTPHLRMSQQKVSSKTRKPAQNSNGTPTGTQNPYSGYRPGQSRRPGTAGPQTASTATGSGVPSQSAAKYSSIMNSQARRLSQSIAQSLAQAEESAAIRKKAAEIDEARPENQSIRIDTKKKVGDAMEPLVSQELISSAFFEDSVPNKTNFQNANA